MPTQPSRWDHSAWPGLPGARGEGVTSILVCAMPTALPRQTENWNRHRLTGATSQLWGYPIPKMLSSQTLSLGSDLHLGTFTSQNSWGATCGKYIEDEPLPSSSLRVLLAISLISMRDSDKEWVTGMAAMPTPMEVGGVMTLETRGDFRGRSMLLPTKFRSGILYRFLDWISPERRLQRKDEEWKSARSCERIPSCPSALLACCLAPPRLLPGLVLHLPIGEHVLPLAHTCLGRAEPEQKSETRPRSGEQGALAA